MSPQLMRRNRRHAGKFGLHGRVQMKFQIASDKAIGALGFTSRRANTLRRQGEWSMREHTPGPWEVLGDARMVVGHDDKGMMTIADIRGWGHLMGNGHGAIGLSAVDAIEILRANARLIAAAPELLEALRPFADPDNAPLIMSDAHSLALIEKARAAIAKADTNLR